MAEGRPTALLGLYAGLCHLSGPFAYRRVAAKLRAHGTDPARIRERMGHATEARPAGTLMWFHAASVGESVSILRLIAHLGDAHTDLSFLITSGTATSAQVLAARLPPRTAHQFAPLDSPRAVARFLDHWRPDAGVFVESELWPNMLRGAARRRIPLALLNARISDRTARGWARIAGTARYLLSHFAMIHCQDARTAAHFQALGVPNARAGANLKAMAGPLACDQGALDRLRAQIGARPVWAMASTHPGEEEIALAAHANVLRTRPDALLLLIPRHPERAGEVTRLIDAAGLRMARRSAGQDVPPGCQVYLADTLGEMGLWYALVPIVCLGGSFTPVGGHNPYEPAHAGAAVLHGPLHANFSDAYARMDAAGAALSIPDAEALGPAVARLLNDAAQLQDMRQAATDFAAAQEDRLAGLASELCAALKLG